MDPGKCIYDQQIVTQPIGVFSIAHLFTLSPLALIFSLLPNMIVPVSIYDFLPPSKFQAKMLVVRSQSRS